MLLLTGWCGKRIQLVEQSQLLGDRKTCFFESKTCFHWDVIINTIRFTRSNKIYLTSNWRIINGWAGVFPVEWLKDSFCHKYIKCVKPQKLVNDVLVVPISNFLGVLHLRTWIFAHLKNAYYAICAGLMKQWTSWTNYQFVTFFYSENVISHWWIALNCDQMIRSSFW